MPATQVKRRRGTTAENDAFTGAEGEITVDVEKHELRVHDGVTQGGFKIGGSSGSGRNIGDIFYTTRTDTALAGAVECNGGTYSTADYTGDGSIGELLASGKLDYISLTDYATAISTKGWCDKIGWDGAGTTSFRVPTLTPHIVQKNNIPVVGNGKNIGWTDGTTEYSGVGQTYQGVGITGIFGEDVSKTLPATASGLGYEPSQNKMYGVTTDPTKSGIIADTTDTAQLRVMFQLFNSTTDEAVATVGTVVAQVGELRNMSNITPTGKETVVGWGMPDYSAGIAMSTAINTPQLIQCDGLLLAYEVGVYVQIDLCDSSGNTIVANLISNTGYAGAVGGGNALVSKGSYIKNITAPTALTLYPLKGVNNA